ncbi:GNAT family N-acetyltransferase [Tabrizicola sp.]|uniref:GNAT family N-acetyltransferase n=1 Tax=Tabrizicola sp. TaxID=2005166 RepID=UPI001A41D772|nr:GNAT family N-acetyltransferase [Tabrizicola sp.]MBL9073335.1 GNAT family N-acetyltransferase [Tabrizicola sp.]
MRIRELFPSETALVAQFYREAPDYWLLAKGRCDPENQASDFFTDAPPNCNPAESDRLGLFVDHRLSGVAELSYGFPERNDAYLGLMILGPWAQGRGHGRSFLAHLEKLARGRHAPRLYLAVLDANLRGRAFWEREGFRPTGIRRQDAETGHWIERLVKPL